jgi:hypothetical protein
MRSRIRKFSLLATLGYFAATSLQAADVLFAHNFADAKALLELKASEVTVADSRCSFKELAKLVFAHPYFVGPEKICRLDAANKTIEIVSAEGMPFPSVYSVMFWGEDEKSAYFLANGRAWETEGDAYLHLLLIDKKTHALTYRELISDLPGYSGAMWKAPKDFYLTAFTEKNTLYVLNAAQMSEAIHKSLKLKFEHVAKPLIQDFEGLSLKLVVGADYYLFDNGEYPSFLLSKGSAPRSVLSLPENCTVLGPQDKDWLLFCASEGKTQILKSP